MNHEEFVAKMRDLNAQEHAIYMEKSRLNADYHAEIESTLLVHDIEYERHIIFCGIPVVRKMVNIEDNGTIEVCAAKPDAKRNKVFVLWRGSDISEFIKKVEPV